MRKLKDIPKHMRTREWILSEIKHESFQGITTVHKCECGNFCRSVMCAECWKEVLKRKK